MPAVFRGDPCLAGRLAKRQGAVAPVKKRPLIVLWLAVWAGFGETDRRAGDRPDVTGPFRTNRI